MSVEALNSPHQYSKISKRALRCFRKSALTASPGLRTIAELN
jgi:hypothetical protein